MRIVSTVAPLVLTFGVLSRCAYAIAVLPSEMVTGPICNYSLSYAIAVLPQTHEDVYLCSTGTHFDRDCSSTAANKHVEHTVLGKLCAILGELGLRGL
jgi:hypothetical protein